MFTSTILASFDPFLVFGISVATKKGIHLSCLTGVCGFPVCAMCIARSRKVGLTMHWSKWMCRKKKRAGEAATCADSAEAISEQRLGSDWPGQTKETDETRSLDEPRSKYEDYEISKNSTSVKCPTSGASLLQRAAVASHPAMATNRRRPKRCPRQRRTSSTVPFA